MVRLYLFVLLVALTLVSGPGRAEVIAQLDRTDVAENESFGLTFLVDKQFDSPPDFAPLERDFEILQRNQQSSTQIVNGRIRTERRWVLTLMPRQVGEFEIPPVRFGDEWSSPGTVKVVPARSAAPGAAEIYLETDVSTTRPWVQSQVIYKVRLYVAADVDTRNATLGDPGFDGPEVLVEKLGDDRQYQSTQQGRRYLVVERSYALFPQQSGTLRILPARLEVQMITRAQRFPRLQRFLSGEVELDVRPIPALPPGMPGGAWLPATKVSIDEQWSTAPDALKPGEPVTRTVTLTADGLLASQLPELPGPGSSRLRFYPDQPELTDRVSSNGFSGRRTERTAIIAPQGGQYRVPSISVPWWNTATGAWEVAELGERSIDVAAAPADAQQQSSPDPDDATGDVQGDGFGGEPAAGGWSSRLAWLLGCGWLVTVLAWAYSANVGGAPRSARRSGRNEAFSQRRGATRQLRRAAIRACREGSAAECRAAVRAWAAAEWPTEQARTLAEIAGLAGRPLAVRLLELEQALYSASQPDWNGAALAEALKSYERVRVRPGPASGDALAPLHP